MEVKSNPESAMAKELNKLHAEGGFSDEELPEGANPIEARKEDEEGTEAEAELAASSGEEPETPVAEEPEEETLIRIGDREFKSEKEALKYAEKLEADNQKLAAYNEGIRDTLGATATPVAAEPVEDNFDEKFYANPKGTLAEVKQQAKDELRAELKAEREWENMWSNFLTEYPDIRRSDAERILFANDNWPVLSKMKDIAQAQKIIAQKVRADYAEIEELRKPRVELSNKRGAQVAPSGGSRASVTPTKKEDAPLDFVSQLKRMRG